MWSSINDKKKKKVKRGLVHWKKKRDRRKKQKEEEEDPLVKDLFLVTPQPIFVTHQGKNDHLPCLSPTFCWSQSRLEIIFKSICSSPFCRKRSTRKVIFFSFTSENKGVWSRKISQRVDFVAGGSQPNFGVQSEADEVIFSSWWSPAWVCCHSRGNFARKKT